MFYNISNHPSADWSKEQTEAAGGKIVDVPFPAVDPKWSSSDVRMQAMALYYSLPKGGDNTYLVQGEFSFTYALTSMLVDAGFNVVVATSKREAIETKIDDGTTKKFSVFNFVQFRQLRHP